jgi:ATP-binding cassette subfamily F protein uup
VGRLSGGERARILIARVMLEPADVLLLDEPTNDLDIQTLEILEESLLEYRGALVMVTHDRYLLDRVSKIVVGLDAQGNIAQFADYSQWSDWSRREKQAAKSRGNAAAAAAGNTAVKKKLSYIEAREFANMEQRIAEAEELLAVRRSAFESPEIAVDAHRLLAAQSAMEEAQKAVDDLYARWAELESKQQ